MAAKVKSVYVCNQCGFESPKWNGKCQSCGAWNSFEEEQTVQTSKASAKRTVDVSSQIYELSDVDASIDDIRYSTGVSELDRVLGGGLVKGSLVLLGGEPGIGKSTLLLQICEFLGKNYSILYISGEESVRQII